ncbi:MAG: sigma-54-dependent Fis family transcriptional regulator [Xanthomonadaceae bacterium]|nr:sigma-54-dependent Fis family transcriptional regulator [Xanthomonadaceae bacterium]MDE2317451.1 sigma-54-dependent Fis family transcriptional regulator [Xanthomonadaceae bacterium]
MSLPSRQAISAARQRFFETGASPRGLVGETILASWRRCRAIGLAPEQRVHAEPPGQPSLRELRERNEALLRLCRPELDLLYADARTSDSIVILATPDSTILEANGSTGFLDKAARVALRPGVSWREDLIGTNAIGTALHEGRAVEVHGGEHYFGDHRVLSCSASPILDGRGRPIGLLDISSASSVHHAHALGIVQLAIEQIERRLLEREAAGRDVIRLHHDAALLDTSREGILVFEDERLVAANRQAIQMLGLDWSELGRRRYHDLFESARPPSHLVIPLRGRDGEAFHARRQSGEHARIGSSAALPSHQPATTPGSMVFFSGAQDAQLIRGTRLLDADIPVLLQGETGTGKEVWARELHRRSRRAGRAFVAINCAALPEGLIEAELFGYQSGAFTGARRNGAPGLLREADGGVLFLDEIGDMPLTLQSRLLRVLQEREVHPLGSSRPVKVDFAIIAATLRPLEADVAAGRFRADLYYRIAQSCIALPPLRERDDCRALIVWLWQHLGADTQGITLAPETLEQLSDYAWPGNIRQLSGTLKTLVTLAERNKAVLPGDLPDFLRQPSHASFADHCSRPQEVPRLHAVARDTMQAALDACQGNVSEAARRLGISRSTLYRRLERKDDRPVQALRRRAPPAPA